MEKIKLDSAPLVMTDKEKIIAKELTEFVSRERDMKKTFSKYIRRSR